MCLVIFMKLLLLKKDKKLRKKYVFFFNHHQFAVGKGVFGEKFRDEEFELMSKLVLWLQLRSYGADKKTVTTGRTLKPRPKFATNSVVVV